MITKFIKEVKTKINPFARHAKPARLFLASLPPKASSQGMSITTQLLPRSSTEPTSLYVKFRDGKELNLDCQKVDIKAIVEEVDRHSRTLQKQADLSGE